MKRSAQGTFHTFSETKKRMRAGKGGKTPSLTRKGFASVARSRGAAVTGEMKYMDSELQAGIIPAVTTTWVAGTSLDPSSTLNLGSAAVANPLCLCAPTVGSGLNQRVGRSILVRKIKVSGQVSIANQATQVAADAGTKVRILLVQDMQTNASQMTGAQLMRDAGAAASTINSYQNPDNFGRFRVLKDKVVNIGDLNMAQIGTDVAPNLVQSGLVRHFKMAINFRIPVKVQFNATNGGTVADIVDNSFHIVCGCNNTALNPVLSYYCRVGYKE